MLSKRLVSGLVVLFMVLSAVPVLIGTSTGNEETRWGNPATGLVTERAISKTYTGAPMGAYYEDLTNDGSQDALVFGVKDNGTAFFAIISLKDGSTYYEYMFNEALAKWEIHDNDGNGWFDLIFLEDDSTDSYISAFSTQTKTWPMYREKYTRIINQYGNPHFEIKGDELVFFVRDSTHMLTVHAKSLTTYADTWTSPRLPNVYFYDYNYDLDGDGVDEVYTEPSWGGGTYETLMIFDMTQHKMVLNSTYLMRGNNRFDFVDLGKDGFYEILICNHNTTNTSTYIYAYTSKPVSGMYAFQWSAGDFEAVDMYSIYYHSMDFSGNGVNDIFFTAYPSGANPHFIFLEGTNGTVFGNFMFVWSGGFNLYFGDFSGDSIMDVSFYNYSGSGNVLNLRLLQGGATIIQAYNATFLRSNLISFQYVHVDADPLVEFMISLYNPSGIDYIANTTIFELKSCSVKLHTQNHDCGPMAWAGKYKTNIYFNTDGSAVLTALVDYLDPTPGGDNMQLFVYNISTGLLVYTSPKVNINAVVDLYHLITVEDYCDVNSDGYNDLIMYFKWQEPSGTKYRGNITIVSGNGFAAVWKTPVPDYDLPKFFAFESYTLNLAGGKTEQFLRVSQRINGQDSNNYTLYKTEDLSFVKYYQTTLKYTLDFYELDVTGEGLSDIAFLHSNTWSEFLEFFFLNTTANKLQYLNTVYLPATGIDDIWGWNPLGDDDVTLLITGSNYMKVINTRDWAVKGDFSADQVLYEEVNVNGDLTEDLVVYPIIYEAGRNQSQIYIFDLEDGDKMWESGPNSFYPIDSAYNCYPEFVDIENDQRLEWILPHVTYGLHSNYWFQIQTNDIKTNLRPKAATPIPGKTMAEDTVDSGIDLDTAFTDDGALQFSAVDSLGKLGLSVDATTHVLTITPVAEWSGNTTVNVTCFDGYWTLFTEFFVNVTPVNDVPIITAVNGIDAKTLTMISFTGLAQDVQANFTINATDADGTPLTFALWNTAGLNVTIGSLSGALAYTPSVADGAGVTFQVNVTDANSTGDTIELNLSIVNTPHTPFNVTIVEPLDNAVLEAKVNLTGSADDLDLPWGDELNFTWTSDVDGILGYGKVVKEVNLTYGQHNITLTAKDSTDREASATVTVFWNVTNGPVKKNPEWWYFYNDDKAGTGDLWIEFKGCQVNTTMETDKPSPGKTTMTTEYSFSGTSHENITVIHMYWGMQEDDKTFMLTPFYDPGNAGVKLEITPEGGKWSWTGKSELEFDTPVPTDDDVINTTDDDTTPAPVYTTWYSAVGWDEWGNYAIDHQKVGVVEPGDDDIVDDDVDDDVTGPTFTITTPKDNAEFAPSATITVSGTSWNLTVGTNVTVTLGALNATAAIGTDGKWSTTIAAPAAVGTYALSAEAPGVLTTSVDIVVKEGITVDDDDDDTGYSSGMVYGMGAAIGFLLLLVIILVIVVIVVASKKKKGAEEPKPAEKEGAPAPPAPEDEKTKEPAGPAPPAPEDGKTDGEPSGPEAPAPPEEAEPESAKADEEKFEKTKGDKEEDDSWELEEDAQKPPAPPPAEAEFDMDEDDDDFEIKA